MLLDPDGSATIVDTSYSFAPDTIASAETGADGLLHVALLSNPGATGPLGEILFNQDSITQSNVVFKSGGATTFVAPAGSEIIVDNNRTHVREFDTTNTQVWTERERLFDSSNRLTIDTLQNDDATFERIAYNSDGTHTVTTNQLGETGYSSVTRRYDSADRLLSETLHNDDGSSSVVTRDAAGAQAWATRMDFFDPSYNLKSETVLYDDTRVSVRTNDVAGAQPWLSDYSLRSASGVLLQQDILFDDGSRRATVSDVAGAETWSIQTKVFDGFGRVTEQSETNDDNTRSVQLNDVGSANWTSTYSVYSAGNQLSKEDIEYDDHTHQATFYDLAGSQPWSRKIETTDAHGNVTAQREFNDDGSRSERINDFGSANWSSVYNVYTAADQISKQDIDYDDHTHVATLFDRAGAFAWSTQTETRDAHGRLTQQTQYNDNLTGTVTDFDVGAASWARQATSYDALGNRISVEVQNDNGTRNVTYYDPGHTHASWSSEVDYFDASNQLVMQVETNDQVHTRTEIAYDPYNQNSNWSRTISEYTAAGRQTYIEVHDNGTSTLTRYDLSNQYWTTIVDEFGTNGQRLSQFGVFDAGGVWGNSYNVVVNGVPRLWDSELFGVPGNSVNGLEIPNGGHVSQTWDGWVNWGLGPNGQPLNLRQESGSLHWTGEGPGGLWMPGSGTDFAGDGYDNPTWTFDLGGSSFDTGFFDGSFSGGNFDGGVSPNWYGGPFGGGWFDDGWFGPGGFGGDWFNGGWFNGSALDGWSFDSGLSSIAPVVLDLDGNGAQIALLGASTASFDMDGQPGREHTAWAGGGDGLLAIDLAANGAAGADGVIDQTREIVFTGWAANAGSDLAALHAVFDTNHNNRLDAADARFGEFRVWQDANHDGLSQPGEVKTLSQLGIAWIDLTPTGPALAFADGSGIKGLATFTRTDGSKGTAADASFSHEGDAHPDAVQSNTTVNLTLTADGATVSAVSERDSAGHLISERVTTTAAGGRIDVQEDTNGDGETDRTQASWTDGNGLKTVVQKDFGIDGALLGQVTTTWQSGVLTSRTAIYADGSTAVTQYDAAGTQPWTSDTSRTDDIGRLTSRLIAGDDGVSTETIYDVDDEHAWSTRILATIAAGLLSETLNLENGTKEVRTYDPGDNGGWSRISLYDSLGRLTSDSAHSDDGSSTTVSFDLAATQPWSTRIEHYTSLAQLASVTETGDDGSSATTVYDLANQQIWSARTTRVDAAGNDLAQDTRYDDGTRTLSEYDSANQANWTSRVQIFDASNARTSMFMIFDEGWLSYFPSGATLSGGTANENSPAGTAVGTVTGIDPDADAVLSYELINSAGSRFAINATTGAITVASGAVLDYEAAASHSIIVRVTDQAGLAYDKTFTIALTNLNEALAGATLPSHTVAENSAGGTVVGTLGNVVVEAGAGPLTFSLPGSAGGRFAINVATGEITVVAGASLNYEAASDHTVTVRATDQAGKPSERSFTINVTNVNEAPTGATLAGGSVLEHAANNTVVGTVTGVDPDAGATFSYALTVDAGQRFAINAATGAITVANGSLLDFQTANSHAITVRVTDQGGLTYDKDFTITVENSNHAPTDATLSGNHTVREHSASGTAVGTVTGVDPDVAAALSYSLVDDAGGRFKFDPGQPGLLVTAGDMHALDTAVATSHSVTVRVTDQGGLSYNESFTITVTPQTVTAPSGGGSSTTIYDAQDVAFWSSFRTDRDANGNIVYQLGINDGGGRWENEYDNDSTRPWSTVITVHDAANRLVSQTINWDSGTHTLNASDAGNAFSWASASIQFDADWNFVSLTGTNDGGGSAIESSEVWTAYDTLVWYAVPHTVQLPPLGGGHDLL